MCVCQSCPAVCDPVACSPAGSSVHGILQARIPEWIAIPFAIQGPSPGLRHLRQSLHHLNHRGSPWYRLEGPELAIPRMRESLLLYPSCWSWPLSSMGCCGRSLSKELHRANSAVPLDNSPGKFFPKLTQPPIGVLVCLLEKYERNL